MISLTVIGDASSLFGLTSVFSILGCLNKRRVMSIEISSSDAKTIYG